MILKRMFLLLAVGFGLCSGGASAQFVNLADAAQVVYRAVDQREDSTFVFVFFSPTLGSLKARSVNGLSANFSWFKLNMDPVDPFNSKIPPSLSSTPFYTNSNVVSSQVGSLAEGGYMVRVEQPEVVDTFWAWVFLDEIRVDSIVVNNTCDFLTLTAQALYRPNYYYWDFTRVNDIQLRFLPNDFRLAWDASTDIRDGVPASDAWKLVRGSLITRIELPAPLRSATYSAKMTNVFGNTASGSTGPVPLIASYARFDVLTPDANGVFAPSTDLKGEALFTVRLSNNSVNADSFVWKGLGDQNNNLEKNRVLWSHTTRDVPGEKSYRPGTFPINLSVVNAATGCSSSNTSKLEVLASNFNPESIPNAFSPNGDGLNDVFTFVSGNRPVSMNQINVKILNRNGAGVYSFSGDPKKWSGWDGRMNGSGGECASGVYYYVFNGVGWDDRTYSGKQYSGSLHLFRGD